MIDFYRLTTDNGRPSSAGLATGICPAWTKQDQMTTCQQTSLPPYRSGLFLIIQIRNNPSSEPSPGLDDTPKIVITGIKNIGCFGIQGIMFPFPV